jgi:hypothetical protein
MVHALTEIWRTLVPGGILLDIRPYLPFRPLELVMGPEVKTLGRLDEADFDPGDPAADEAVAEAMRRGLFRLQETGWFYYSSYWDSIADLREYLRDWFDVARLPRRLAGAARSALRLAGPASRLRLQTYVVVNVMGKLPG